MFAGLLLAAAVTNSFAITFNVTPIADALVSSANPANNYGGAGAISIATAGLPKGEQQTLLKFDLAAAKASFDTAFGAGSWALDSVSLQLTATNPGNPLFNASAAGQIAVSWMLNDGWTEGSGSPSSPGASGITWNTLPSFISPGDDDSMSAFNFSGATSGTATYLLSVSPGFHSDAAAGGLASIRLFAADNAVAGLFNSRSFTTAASRPVLMLTAEFVPEPAAGLAASFGFGGIVLLFCRRSPIAAKIR
jgi:hypothetical protein